MKKRMNIEKTLIVLLFLILIIFTTDNVKSLETSVNVPETNFPPIQIKNIPDQSWPMNKNLSNSIDLDEYFIDYEDIIIYNFTNVENITIIINETTNEVSFYSDINFTGERNVTFIASDGFINTTSNLVLLNVTNDIESPHWYNLTISETNITQNKLVTFSAEWTDNMQLQYYIFSINEGLGWQDFTIYFTGIQNTSTYDYSITAAPGTNVLWKFKAYDTSNNYNETTTEFFTVQQTDDEDSSSDSRDSDSSSSGKKITKGAQPTSTTRTRSTSSRGFDVIPDNIAIELKQGESITKLIKIQNLGLKEENFTIEIEGLEEFLIINENNLSIKSGTDAVIALLFKSTRKSVPDIYFGKLIVSTLDEEMHVPIVLTINPLIYDFEVKINIDERYKIIRPGESIEAEIAIINKKDIPNDNITLFYSVMDFFGQIIDQNEEILNFTEESIRLTRNFTIPIDAIPGDYIFYARASRENKISMDIDEFIVGESFSLFSFLIKNLIYIIISLIFIITLLLFIYYHRTKERERLLNLYIMVNELKKLIEENKIDEAILEYNKIKIAYKEKPITMNKENETELKMEMTKLISEFNSLSSVKNLEKEIKEKKENKEDKKEENKEDKKEENKEDKKEETKEDKKEETKEDKKEETKEDKKEETKEDKKEKVKKRKKLVKNK
jgi:hypothetical protein